MKRLKENHKEFIKNNKLISKSQQTFRSEEHNAFTEEVKKITLSGNDDKRIQSFNLIEAYAYGTRKDLRVNKKKLYVTI